MSSQIASNYNATQDNANLTAPNHANNNGTLEKDFENGELHRRGACVATALQLIQNVQDTISTATWTQALL